MHKIRANRCRQVIAHGCAARVMRTDAATAFNLAAWKGTMVAVAFPHATISVSSSSLEQLFR